MRKTLLNHYHSETLTHSGFIIAIIIGILGLIANWVIFFDRGTIPILIFYATFSIVTGLACYAGGRIYYWTALSNHTLMLTEDQFKDYKVKEKENLAKDEKLRADIALMQCAVADKVKNCSLKSLQIRFSKLSTDYLFMFAMFLSIVIFVFLLVASVLMDIV